MKSYNSNYEGKEQFVNEILKPMMLTIDMGWTNVEYEVDRAIGREVVILTNANKSKTLTVNVFADSIQALVTDVMMAALKLTYKINN